MVIAAVKGTAAGDTHIDPAVGGRPPSRDQSGASNAGQPPAEAINTCSGLSENASCQFNAPHGAITGACALIQDQLACAVNVRP